MRTITLLVTSLLASSVVRGQEPPRSESPRPGVAVVELFTSEGCSSCPPADELLADMARENPRGSRVFMLAFHVDYWDYIGWKDRFATPEFTRRQRAYAASLPGSQYTPQMVVNGSEEFVGSDGKRARAEVQRALAGHAVAGVVISSVREAAIVNGGAGAKRDEGCVTLEVSVELSGVSAGSKVHGALTENGLSTGVKRGENASRTLKHEGVVRAFTTGAADVDGPITLKLDVPSDVARDKASVVVYVQAGETGRVLGAASEALSVREKAAPK